MLMCYRVVRHLPEVAAEAVSAVVAKSPADIEEGNSLLLCSLLGVPLAGISGS